MLLPDTMNITGKGRSPLENVPEFVNVKCPKCGGDARRETDTMDTFVDSSWYFYRYCDPQNSTAPFDPGKIDLLVPDRSIHRRRGARNSASDIFALLDQDDARYRADSNGEPVSKLFTQGMVIRNGEKMSKSKGNVVPADDVVEQSGADTARLFALFAAPPEKDVDWIDTGIDGISRFLGRIYRFATRNLPPVEGDGSADTEVLRKLHQTLRKITEDFENRWHFNTSIAAVMELLNLLYAQEPRISAAVKIQAIEILSLMLAPFAPFLAQELWEEQGHTTPVFKHPWPVYDAELARASEAEVMVQINGKNRSKLTVAPGTDREQLERLALADERVAGLMQGKTPRRVIVVPDKLVNIVL